MTRSALKSLMKLTQPYKIRCASITCYNKSNRIVANLKELYTDDEMLCFLEKLNYEYDETIGCRESGVIWLQDNTWIEIYDKYDIGKSGWYRIKPPPIPMNL